MQQMHTMKVRCDSLTPRQHPTPLNFQKSCDYYVQRMIKCDEICAFHSRAELLHAALLEADSSVSFYVPQPFKFRIGKNLYTPDCYLEKNGKRIIRELKPRGEFNESKKMCLEQYCSFHNIEFQVISNEWVYERELEAINWLEIIRTLATNRYLETEKLESDLWIRFLQEGSIPYGELVDLGSRLDCLGIEVSTFRLLQRGKITANLSKNHLDYDTVFSSCV